MVGLVQSQHASLDSDSHDPATLGGFQRPGTLRQTPVLPHQRSWSRNGAPGSAISVASGWAMVHLHHCAEQMVHLHHCAEQMVHLHHCTEQMVHLHHCAEQMVHLHHRTEQMVHLLPCTEPTTSLLSPFAYECNQVRASKRASKRAFTFLLCV